MRRCIQISPKVVHQHQREVDGNHGQGFVMAVIDERNNNEVGLTLALNTPWGVQRGLHSVEAANESPCVALLDGILWRLSERIHWGHLIAVP